VKCHQAEEKL